MKPKSLVVKRSIVVAGHKTSVSLEDVFWKALKGIQDELNADRGDDERHTTLGDIIAEIDDSRPKGANLSCAIRLYVVDRLKVEVSRLQAEAA